MITGAITAGLSVAVIYLATERVSLQRLNRMLGRGERKAQGGESITGLMLRSSERNWRKVYDIR